MPDLQEQYKVYRFIEPSEAEEEAKTETEDLHMLTQHIVASTYELPHKWYFLVFAPLDASYDKNPDWFAVKGIEYVRKRFKRPEAYIVTREIVAKKVHINVLICTSEDLLLQHGKIVSHKYRIFAEVCKDRHKVHKYITKEAMTREFKRYLDYMTYLRNNV